MIARASAAATLLLAAAAVTPRWEAQRSGVAVRLRGVSAVSRSVAWASGAGGTVLRTTDGGASWRTRKVPGAEALDFRDVDALSERVALALSIGNGGTSRIYRTTDGGESWHLRLSDPDPRLFLDAMAFGRAASPDEAHGVAVADSIASAFVVFTTEDGGRTWARVPGDRLPAALPGEAAFAASGTNVAMAGGHVWIGTSAGRVLRSTDGGRSWSVAATPVATGPAAGIFSIAFRDERHGAVVGGDYQKESEAVANAAFTEDGGMTWTLAKGLGGYRSAVACAPDGSFVALGPSGADRSADDGRSWTPLPGGAEGFDTLSFAPGGHVGWAAGNGGRLARITWNTAGHANANRPSGRPGGHLSLHWWSRFRCATVAATSSSSTFASTSARRLM